MGDKEKRVQAAMPDKFVKLNRAHLNDADRKKVLEMFVENDDTLGQLLDFISSHYIQNSSSGAGQPKESASNATLTSNRSGRKASINQSTHLAKSKDQASVRPH